MKTTLALLMVLTMGCREKLTPPVLVPGAPTTITISESNFTIRLENIVPVPRLIESNQAQREISRPAWRINNFDWSPTNIQIEVSHRPVLVVTTNGKYAIQFKE